MSKMPGAVSFDALDDVQLAKWINQTLKPLGKRMDRAACDMLAFTSGRDLTLLSGELHTRNAGHDRSRKRRLLRLAAGECERANCYSQG